MLGLVLCIALLCTGCGASSGPRTEIPRGNSAASEADPAKASQEEEEVAATETATDAKGLYMIESFDGEEEFVILKHLSSTRQVRYSYNLDTKFLNKYGNVESWSSFTPGMVVEIVESTSLDNALASIQLSPRVWVQEDVTNYKIDLSRDILQIVDKNYQLTTQTEVFSHGISSYITDVGAEDQLRIVGQDKEIYSITVTSGHGYISLVNTQLFEGSLITVGDEVVALITENMVFEVPEGTYDVTVANDGYGGTKSVTVERNQTLTLDLNELKGEGPKYCHLTFECRVEGATIYLDGTAVATNQQHEVKYGRHSLIVAAEGYDTWSRTLFVNSPNATIMLDLESTESAKKNTSNSSDSTNANNDTNSNTNNTSNSNNSSNSSANTTNNNSSSSSSTNKNYTEQDAQLDYLTTISNMISNLTGN